MKTIIAAILICISNTVYSQSISQIDSLSYVICDYLKTLDQTNDPNLKIGLLLANHIYPYSDKLDNSESLIVEKRIFYRLQRNCIEFSDLLEELSPSKNGMLRKTTKPISKLSKREIKKFKERTNFKYFEANGNTTFVNIQNERWIETFTDKTYSILDYKWISNSEFELTFIESNNETRAGISINGDKYIYNIIEKKTDYYIVSLNIPGQKVYEEFKLYFK